VEEGGRGSIREGEVGGGERRSREERGKEAGGGE
jgi:hypothetical protein